jgi:hypothetical protein
VLPHASEQPDLQRKIFLQIPDLEQRHFTQP